MSNAESIVLRRVLNRSEKLLDDCSVLTHCQQWKISEEDLEDILVLAQDIYELVSSGNETSGYLSFRFIKWFCKVFRFRFTVAEIRKILSKSAKEKYK